MMLLVLGTSQKLFFVVSLVAILMLATVSFMISSDGYENNDRLKKFLEPKD